jgi:hypothetical protein
MPTEKNALAEMDIKELRAEIWKVEQERRVMKGKIAGIKAELELRGIPQGYA